jgi:hypothetical protein
MIPRKCGEQRASGLSTIYSSMSRIELTRCSESRIIGSAFRANGFARVEMSLAARRPRGSEKTAARNDPHRSFFRQERNARGNAIRSGLEREGKKEGRRGEGRNSMIIP